MEMTKQQHDKLQKLYALCDVCKYQDCCMHSIKEQLCPEISGDMSAYVVPEGFSSFDAYATQIATNQIYDLLKDVRRLVMIAHSEDPYLSMCILPDPDFPGRIMFNNTHWELPEEKQINFHENVDNIPIPTNLQVVIRDSRR